LASYHASKTYATSFHPASTKATSANFS
jgi:hypothetical protein